MPLSDRFDPIPPGHGEPVKVGARPKDYCPRCLFPWVGMDICPVCGKENRRAA